MTANHTPGIWEEKIGDVNLRFDTTTDPQIIYIQKQGKSPIKYERQQINVSDVERAHDMAELLKN